MIKRRLSSRPVFALCAAFLSLSTSAEAQRVGTYSGLQANGQPFSLGVSRYKGQLIVGGIDVQVNTTCRDGETLVEDTGYGQVGPIINGAGQDSFNFGSVYFNESFSFDEATRSVSGFVEIVFSQFRPPPAGSVSPPKSTFCSTGKQAYAAVLGKDVQFDPHARVVRYHRPEQ